MMQVQAAEAPRICAAVVLQPTTQGMQAGIAGVDSYWRNNYTPPAQLSQIANTPCMSRELQRINGQMNSMLRQAGNSLNNSISLTGSAAGPLASIMNNAFKGDTNTFNSSASIIPNMLNFQSLASNALGGLLQELGLGDAFSGKVCGIMLDMVLKYIQCENPIKFPNLSNLFGKLELNLPGGCAGQSLRAGLYAAQRNGAAQQIGQSVTSSMMGQ